MILTKEGKVMVAGKSNRGALGLGDDLKETHTFTEVEFNTGGSKIVKLAAGDDFNLALDENGRLHSWGYNRTGQLGH